MNRLWQSTPSSAFKTGLYKPYLTVGEARLYGDFGMGEYEYLDGEVTAIDGNFYRQTSWGKLLPLEDSEHLCFASLTAFAPTDEMTLALGLTETTIQPVYLEAFGTRNAVFAMRIQGTFAKVTTTAVPRQSEPFVAFDKVPHQSFDFKDIDGTMVCFYSPAYLSLTGIAGFHYHFLAKDRSGGGHVTAFTLSTGRTSWCRLECFSLGIPRDPAFDQASI